MTEMAKTLTFLAAAAVALMAAFVVGPREDDFDVQQNVGRILNQFDVEEAKRMKIVTFDQETASMREFEVAEQDGLWTIPSKQDYPADAIRQMGAAATCMIDRKVLRIAAESAAQHAELGVVDPTAPKLDTKATGVGTRVFISNNSGSSLVNMIIGKQVPDTEQQYYVRNTDQDVVYVVNLEPENLSTQFEDWIEKDLLQLNTFDIRHLHVKDYSIEMRRVLTPNGRQMQVGWDRRGEFRLAYDDTESIWLAEQLQEFNTDKEELVDFSLGENQELNDEALSELRSGLDDLTIVDVERKPSGLSADLKAGGDFLKDIEAADSLINRGFAPISPNEGEDLDILSSEGEIVCTLRDGVEYVLRFGNLQMDSDAPVENGATGASEENPDAGIHRYLFVMARFNETMIEKPELAELPELPEDSEEPAASEGNPAEEQQEDEPAGTEEADTKAEDAEDSTEPTELEKLIAERKSIEADNQRHLDEYQEQLKSGRQRVQELNERFGDWYYVIDNSVYQLIHLGRDDLIKAKSVADEDGNDSPAGGLPGLPNLPLGQGAAK